MQLLQSFRSLALILIIAVAAYGCGGGSGAGDANAGGSGDGSNDGNSSQARAEELGLLYVELLVAAEGLPHSTHKRVDELPSSGILTLNASFSERPEDVSFYIISDFGEEILAVEKHIQDSDFASELGLNLFYLGDFPVPSSSFKIRFKGTSSDGSAFSIELPKVYSRK